MITQPDTVRLVVTADNHLNRFYDRMRPSELNERRKYLRAGFRAAVDYAIEWQAHLFVIAGDLFDQPDPRNIDRVFVAGELARLNAAGIGCYAVGGNHDTPRQSTEQGGRTPQEIYAQLGALHHFDRSDEIETVVVHINGISVAIGGLNPDPTWSNGCDPLDGLVWEHTAELGVLILHGQVEGFQLPDTTAPVFKLSSLAALSKANLFIVGDIHRPAKREIGSQLLVIPGATERMTFGESEDVPGFVALELHRDGKIDYKRHQLAGQPRAELKLRFADLDQTAPFEDIVARTKALCRPDTMVKLSLEGFVSREQYQAFQLRQLYDTIRPKTFHFTLDTYNLRLSSGQFELAKRGVRLSQPEELRAYAEELLAAQTDPQEQALLTEALKAVLEHY